jgi:hypothetical protein
MTGIQSARSVHCGPAATVADLAWMSGHWEGPVFDDGSVLEEHWTQPYARSIAALVRVTRGGATTMMEMIVIEEEEGSLVVRLQRWDPGYQPQTERPQVMKLLDLGSNKVVFEAVDEDVLRNLSYRREGNEFIIFGTTAHGGQIEARLMGK